MSSMYDHFETNTNLEQEGVWIDYGDFRVRASHAGNTNKKYVKYAEAKMKPIRRAVTSGSMDEERSRFILFEIYAEVIVKAWEIKDGEDKATGEIKWKSGINKKGGGILEFNKTNVIATFKKLPKLFFDIQEVATSMDTYRKEDMKEDSKNS